MIGLFGCPDAIGEDFHITSEESLTWNQIYALVAGLRVSNRRSCTSRVTASLPQRRGGGQSVGGQGPQARCSTREAAQARDRLQGHCSILGRDSRGRSPVRRGLEPPRDRPRGERALGSSRPRLRGGPPPAPASTDRQLLERGPLTPDYRWRSAIPAGSKAVGLDELDHV